MTQTARDDQPEFPTLPRAARRLGVSVNTLREAAKSGKLPIYRHGSRNVRVHWPELVAWMRAQRVPPDDHARARVAEVLDRERARRPIDLEPGGGA